MTKWTTLGPPAAALACISLSTALFANACSSSSTPTGNNGKTDTSGPACNIPAAGALPNSPNCDPSSGTCAAAGKCVIDPVCGSQSTCLPMAENANKAVQDFRIRRLNVLSPAALATEFVQKTVVDQGVNLNANGVDGGPKCGELGDGSFTWLIRVDTTTNTVTTGGAPPATDPFGAGYCFANFTKGGLTITPISKSVTFTGQTFASPTVDKLDIPIFVQNDVTNLIVLPIRGASFQNITISAGGDCIGSFNPTAMPDTTCQDSRTDCSKWFTAGMMGGYVTLEDADQVNISLVNKTLCALLVSDTTLLSTRASDNYSVCARDGNNNIIAKGDYCSTSTSAGGCQDSYWLTATFAAAAVTINDGSNDPLCQGATVAADGGITLGTGSGDAGTD